ncbi:hypothetical protein SO694_00057034 [Aureococcus anophagefferens]|uniref:Tim44-like domain-containing protein n=1 Tax=Aureococcus anophagefferens TaxID=44056 RepID=A0ABR1FXC6_AURAN
MEVWRDGVSEELAPDFVDAFIRGDAIALKPWLSEGLFSRLAHEIRLRKEEGLRYDDARIMDVEKMEIIAVQVEDNRSPIVREYDDANHELVWKVVDFQLGGGEPYY